MSDANKIMSKYNANRSYQNWVYRSAPFKISYRQSSLASNLRDKRLKFWRKKYLDGRDAGKVLLVHLGLDRLRSAYYRGDIGESLDILEDMREGQMELGIFMIEMDQIEEIILGLQKRINCRLRGADTHSRFGRNLLRALNRK